MTILVTGASGNVGSRTIRFLADAGHRVRALVRDPDKATGLADIAEVVVADLARPDTLAPAFAGVGKLLLITPVAPEMPALEANAFAAATEAGVRHIVKLSNMGAGTSTRSLWNWHRVGETTLRGLGVPWTILAPARFMSSTPFSWEPVARLGTVVESTAGRELILCDADDVAEVAAKVLTTPGHEGKTYRLTSGEALTGAQLAQKIGTAIGRPVTFTDLPPEVLSQSLVDGGMPDYVIDMLAHYFTMVRERHLHETTTVFDLLGRAPRTYDEWLAGNAEAELRKVGASAVH